MPKRKLCDTDPEFGDNIALLRKAKGSTQQEVADYLNITRPTYTKWESKRAEPSIYHIRKLAEVYEVEIGVLFSSVECKKIYYLANL